MANDGSGLTTIDALVTDLQEDESLFERKANTVTTAIGSTATLILTFLTYYLENGNHVPEWLPMVVVFLGMALTTYGVSQTKNGMTKSVADNLHEELAVKIDENHFHPDPALETQLPQSEMVVLAEDEETYGRHSLELRGLAEALVADKAALD